MLVRISGNGPGSKKVTRLLLVNHTTKAIHHHHQQQQQLKISDIRTLLVVSSVGYFVVIQIYKKCIYNIVIELRKTIQNSMVRGIAQKSCTALFPLWSLRKNDISKMKRKIQRGNIESIERNFDI